MTTLSQITMLYGVKEVLLSHSDRVATSTQKRDQSQALISFKEIMKNLELVFHYPNTFHLPLGCL